MTSRKYDMIAHSHRRQPSDVHVCRQHCHHSRLDGIRHRSTPFQIGVGLKSVIETVPGQAITVGDLNGIHMGLVQDFGDFQMLN